MNTLKLKALLIEKGVNISDIAAALNTSVSTAYRKIKSDKLSIGDINILVNLLQLNEEEVSSVFFAQSFAKNATTH